MAKAEYTFLCDNQSIDALSASKILEAVSGFEVIDSINKTFLVKSEKADADAFAVAHTDWRVSPAVKIPVPSTRLLIKPPSQG